MLCESEIFIFLATKRRGLKKINPKQDSTQAKYVPGWRSLKRKMSPCLIAELFFSPARLHLISTDWWICCAKGQRSIWVTLPASGVKGYRVNLLRNRVYWAPWHRRATTTPLFFLILYNCKFFSLLMSGHRLLFLVPCHCQRHSWPLGEVGGCISADRHVSPLWHMLQARFSPPTSDGPQQEDSCLDSITSSPK